MSIYNKLKEDKIDPSEKICYNCKHLAWLIALGQGLRCTLVKPGNDRSDYKMVPSRRHTCEFFENKNENKEENN